MLNSSGNWAARARSATFFPGRQLHGNSGNGCSTREELTLEFANGAWRALSITDLWICDDSHTTERVALVVDNAEWRRGELVAVSALATYEIICACRDLQVELRLVAE